MAHQQMAHKEYSDIGSSCNDKDLLGNICKQQLFSVRMLNLAWQECRSPVAITPFFIFVCHLYFLILINGLWRF